MSHIFLNISGITVDFDTRFPEYMRQRCAGYYVGTSLPEGAAGDVISIRVGDEELAGSPSPSGEMEAELYLMNLPLSERLPLLGRMMTHGVAVSCDGKGFIFTALSGTGKSTHAFLWQKYLGEDRVRVVNGDKPILWFREDGEILVCGNPWNGKERLDENVCVPLRGICLLERLCDQVSAGEGLPGEERSGELPGGKNSRELLGGQPDGPRIFPASREEAIDFLIPQIYLPSAAEAKLATFELLERLYEKVPVYHLVTDMSREGVMVSSGCLLG